MKEIQETFYQNRFGVATNPSESMQNFVKFISNGEAITNLGAFNSNPDAVSFSYDLMNGLDTWIGEEDQKLMEYFEHYKTDH